MKFDEEYTILVTGSAGFIGSALVRKLLSEGQKVVGIDNLNNYYSKSLKEERLKNIFKEKSTGKKFKFYELNIDNIEALRKVSLKYKPEIIVNLAAQAGVRYSLRNPSAYTSSNLVGFSNILEICRELKVKNFIYASSSSVYGLNQNIPFNENLITDHPISYYAATKKANEILAHSYSHLFNIPTTGLRFFTVYGPWGRPDMAPMLFSKSIINKEPITIYNNAEMFRDFTYIDDVVEAISLCCKKPATANSKYDFKEPEISNSFAPYRILNVGFGKPVKLDFFINLLENYLGIEAIKHYEDAKPGEVFLTYCNTGKLSNWVDYKPKIPIEEGVKMFTEWYLEYLSK